MNLFVLAKSLCVTVTDKSNQVCHRYNNSKFPNMAMFTHVVS